MGEGNRKSYGTATLKQGGGIVCTCAGAEQAVGTDGAAVVGDAAGWRTENAASPRKQAGKKSADHTCRRHCGKVAKGHLACGEAAHFGK